MKDVPRQHTPPQTRCQWPPSRTNPTTELDRPSPGTQNQGRYGQVKKRSPPCSACTGQPPPAAAPSRPPCCRCPQQPPESSSRACGTAADPPLWKSSAPSPDPPSCCAQTPVRPFELKVHAWASSYAARCMLSIICRCQTCPGPSCCPYMELSLQQAPMSPLWMQCSCALSSGHQVCPSLPGAVLLEFGTATVIGVGVTQLLLSDYSTAQITLSCTCRGSCQP